MENKMLMADIDAYKLKEGEPLSEEEEEEEKVLAPSTIEKLYAKGKKKTEKKQVRKTMAISPPSREKSKVKRVMGKVKEAKEEGRKPRLVVRKEQEAKRSLRLE